MTEHSILVLGCTVVHRVGPRETQTILTDGKVVYAVPHDDDSYAAHAAELGYGDDVARMSYEHELLHTLLAGWLGLNESPVMRAVAEDTWQYDPTGSLAAEEAVVLAIQRLTRLCGIDLGQLCAGGATVRPGIAEPAIYGRLSA